MTQVHGCFLKSMHSLHLSMHIYLFPITSFNISFISFNRKRERKCTDMAIKLMTYVLLLQFSYYLQIHDYIEFQQNSLSF